VQHKLRRLRLYDEIWRVLAPSGLFVNADKYAQAGEAHREALRWQLNRFFEVFVPRHRYDIRKRIRDVRFIPKSGHYSA